MKVKFLNPFVEAAVEVLKVEVGADAARGELALESGSLTAEEVNVLISMVGQIKGIVVYSMSQQTGLNILSKMVGEEMVNFDGYAQSGLAELANVITGRATVKLSHNGFISDISPPTVILGKGSKISTLDYSRIKVPLQFEFGTIVAHLALREAL